MCLFGFDRCFCAAGLSLGLLHENAEVLNHTLGKLDPNMIFHVNRGPSGDIVELFTYACLGKLPPIVGEEAFSFSILSRTNHYTDDDLQGLVNQIAASNASTFLKLDGMRFSNYSTYTSCNMPIV